MNLRDIKNNIVSLKKIEKTTNVMKVISSVKVNKFNQKISLSKKSLSFIQDSIVKLQAQTSYLPKIFNIDAHNEVRKKILIVLSSDRGLCSNFNSLINKKFIKFISDNTDNLEIFSIGKRFNSFVMKNYPSLQVNCCTLAELTQMSDVFNFINKLIDIFLSEEVEISILSYDFSSIANQKLSKKMLMPFNIANIQGSTDDQSNIYTDGNLEQNLDFLSIEFMKSYFYNLLLNHVISENCFRMKAMDSASKNTKELIGKKSLLYNRVRQAAITKDLIEIISGAESQV